MTGSRTLAALIFLLALSGAVPAYGYIDPGTGGAVFSSFTSLWAVIGSVLLAAIWPIRMLYRWTRSLAWPGRLAVLVGAAAALGAVVVAILFAFGVLWFSE